MASKNSKMAIIITTCERPKLLEECIASCKKTGFQKEDHIFIVNDAPPPLPGGDPNLLLSIDLCATVINHCRPYYALASARTAGIEAALSEGYKWGLFLDDDMWIEEGCLAAHREAYQRGHTLYRGIVTSERSGGADAFLGDFLERLPGIEMISAGSKRGLAHDLLLRVLRFGGITNTAVDLEALQEAGGFDERFDRGWGYEDTELINRLILRDGWAVQFVRGAVAFHAAAELADNSYTREGSTENRRLFQKLVRGYKGGQ